MSAETITLTFDNGPTPGITDAVLDVLATHHVPAIFFVIGAKADTPDGRALVRRAVADGHRVGAHTWSHSVPFGRLDDDGVRHEIEATAALVGELGGDPSLFRPYGVGGAIDDRLMSRFGERTLVARRQTCVLWNCLPGDWRDEDGWLQVALHDIATRAWSAVVLHDLPHASLGHLDQFLTELRARDVTFSQQVPDDCTPIRDGNPTSSHHLLGVGPPSSE